MMKMMQTFRAEGNSASAKSTTSRKGFRVIQCSNARKNRCRTSTNLSIQLFQGLYRKISSLKAFIKDMMKVKLQVHARNHDQKPL